MDSYEPLPRHSSSSKKFPYKHVHSREKFLCKVILPAIRCRSCPICLRNLDDEHGVAVITNCLHAYCLNCIRRWSKLKRKCPLCTAEFDSWFCNINPRFKTFREEKLPPPRADEYESAAVARSNSNSLDHRRYRLCSVITSTIQGSAELNNGKWIFNQPFWILAS